MMKIYVIKEICKLCITEWADSMDMSDWGWTSADETIWAQNNHIMCPINEENIDEMPEECFMKLEYMMLGQKC